MPRYYPEDTDHNDPIYSHEEMNYDLARPYETQYSPYIVELWSPLYNEFPYDSDGACETYAEAKAFARSSWVQRFPQYYAIIIRGPEGATIYRPMTNQPADEGAS